MKTLATFEDVQVSRNGNTLVLKNDCFRRELDLASGAPRTVSLRTAGGRELAGTGSPVCDLGFIGMHEAGTPETPWQLKRIRCRKLRRDLHDAPRLAVELTMEEVLSQSIYSKTYVLYPGLAAIGMECAIRTPVSPNLYWGRRDQLSRQSFYESTGDALRLAPEIQPRYSVEFRGRSDYEPVPVLEHPAEGNLFTGNLLYCDDGAGIGFVYLQQAPPSNEKRDWEEYDFRFDPESRVLRSCTWGIAPADVQSARQTYCSFRHVLLLYENEAEKENAVKKYLARRYDSSPFYSITVNPWGCGRFPSLVTPAFLKAECKAAAKVGATTYQFDDGWQRGKGLALMSRWNCRVTPEFWEFRENIGKEFPEILQLCRKLGVAPALWFAPSENTEYRDWRIQAERLLELHRKYRISCFKIDAVKLRSFEAEKNLRSFFDTLQKAGGGKLFFNLDVTNGQRFGYLSFLEYGNLFLENRYLFTDGNTAYHPVKTLRALWLLSRYVRPQTLQIEVPYPGDYLARAGAGNPPPEPASCCYPLEYWAAVALFANPLLWFAPSTVPPEMQKRYRRMMKLHLQIREKLFAGEIRPLGEEPSGRSLAGLWSTSGYAIFFRELEAEKTNAVFPELAEGEWKLLAGSGSLKQGKVTMPEKASFALFEKLPAGEKK